MAMFQRYVAIDWSGRGSEHQPVPLAVAEVRNGEQMAIIQPPRFPKVRNWSRRECREWLGTILRPDQPRTVVALDFGLSLPWGADQGVFGCTGWGEMVQSIAKLYGIYGTARATAEAINREPKFGGHGPFRFDGSRTDFRFYLDRDVAYYRLVETAIPQAISQWYLGSGGTVGFHTLTGLAAIHELIAQREAGHVRFQVWPQECQNPMEVKNAHVIAECYPAMYPKPESFGSCTTDHQRDAWKVAGWMSEADERGDLAEAFSLAPLRFGRVAGASFGEQIRFEGWILGVK